MSAGRRKQPGSDKSRKPVKEAQKGASNEVTAEVLEFISAIEAYKKQHNRPFPTWSEVLKVLLSLGYRKSAQPGEPPAPASDD